MTFERIYYAVASPKIFTLFSLSRGRTGDSKGRTSGIFLIERKFFRKIHHYLRK
nr:MAG TPA: hypothetical protein [Caudoviricetes sp.]